MLTQFSTSRRCIRSTAKTNSIFLFVSSNSTKTRAVVYYTIFLKVCPGQEFVPFQLRLSLSQKQASRTFTESVAKFCQDLLMQKPAKNSESTTFRQRLRFLNEEAIIAVATVRFLVMSPLWCGFCTPKNLSRDSCARICTLKLCKVDSGAREKGFYGNWLVKMAIKL